MKPQMIDSPYGRPVPEWIGKTPEEKPPEHVALRIWDRQKGRCYVTGRKIEVGDKKELDHILALADGGENREKNMGWIIVGAHRGKTNEENSRRADERETRKNHFGIKTAPVQKINSAPFPKSERTVKNTKRDQLPIPERRPLFIDRRETVK